MSAQPITRPVRVEPPTLVPVKEESELWDIMRPDYPALPQDAPFEPASTLALGRLLKNHRVVLMIPFVAAVTWCVLVFS